MGKWNELRNDGWKLWEVEDNQNGYWEWFVTFFGPQKLNQISNVTLTALILFFGNDNVVKKIAVKFVDSAHAAWTTGHSQKGIFEDG